MTEKTSKAEYRIRNWREYDAALKNRGSLTFWVDDDVLSGWLNEQKSGKRGASKTYSDLAIATMSTLGSVMRLAGRQTEGFVESLFKLMGVEMSVPNHSTISRRLGKLSVSLPVIEGETHARNQNLKQIQALGRADWKRESGYHHRRSLSETMMFRFKAIFGDACSCRTFNNQSAELYSLVLRSVG